LAETDVSPSTDVSLLWENGHTHMSRLSPPIISQKLCQWFLIFGGGAAMTHPPVQSSMQTHPSKGVDHYFCCE
jgi:hypothetical protein